MSLESLIKRYETMAGSNGLLPEDLKVTVLIDLCHKELRKHLELKQDDLRSEDVRTEIVNYIERTRDVINNQVKAMEVDNVEDSALYGNYQEQEWG